MAKGIVSNRGGYQVTAGGATVIQSQATGQTGVTVTFSQPYTFGASGVALYRNGILMDKVTSFELTGLDNAEEYIEVNNGETSTQVTLNATNPAIADELFQMIFTEGIPAAAGGTAIEITQNAHGFSVLDGVYHDGAIWQKAQADNGATLAQFVVVEVPTAGSFIAFQFGEAQINSHGKIVGEYYFSSELTAGTPTTIEPIAGFSSPLFYVTDINTVIINVYRPASLAETTIALNEITDVTLTVPSNNDILLYDSAAGVWKNRPNYSNPNLLINGRFDIWQRATTATTSGVVTADRWNGGDADGGHTTTRNIFALGQTDVSGNPRYYYNHNQTLAATVGYSFLEQKLEDPERLSGRTVTLSFWAKAAANFTLATDFLGIMNSVSVVDSPGISHSVTTSWQKFSLTETFPNFAAGATKTSNDFMACRFLPISAGLVYNIDIANVKLEYGSISTELNPLSVDEELRNCYRYFRRWNADTAFTYFANGFTPDTVNARFHIPLSYSMRIIPGVTLSAANTFSIEGASGGSPPSVITNYGTTSTTGISLIATLPGVGIASQGAMLLANNTIATYITASAEF